jgi:hypothetical protein
MNRLLSKVCLLLLIGGFTSAMAPARIIRPYPEQAAEVKKGPMDTRDIYRIQGAVRKWTSHFYTSYNRNGVIDTTLSSKTILEYDAAGREIAMESYGRNGEFNQKSREAYDQEGRLIERIVYNADGSVKENARYRYYPEENRMVREDADGRVLDSSRTEHSADGRVKSTYFYDSQGLEIWRDVSHYDADGRVVKTQVFVKGELNEDIVYSYDAAGNKTSSSFFRDSERNTLIRSGIFTTDPENRVLMYILYHTDGRIKDRSAYYYTEDKQIEYSVRVNADETVLEESQSFFDEQGRSIRSLVRREEGAWETSIRYDRDGLKAESLSVASSGMVHRTLYVYNSLQQEIERRVYDGEEPVKYFV